MKQVQDPEGIPTIGDIARAAGVSKGTVSKVLNGRDGVGDETRDRIKSLAQKLDYRPRAAARSLSTGRTGILGLPVPAAPENNLSSLFWSGLAGALAREAAVSGFHVLLLPAENPEAAAFRLESVLKSRILDGLVLPAEMAGPEVLDLLFRNRIPRVILGQIYGSSGSWVDFDNRQGARDLTLRLLDSGIRNPACLAGPASLGYVRERTAGYLRALEERGSGPGRIVHAEYTPPAFLQSVKTVLEDPSVDGIFFGAGDLYLTDSLEHLRRLNKAGLLPGRFPVGVYGDFPLLERFYPGLISVCQSLPEMARTALELLVSLLGDRPEEFRGILLPVTVASGQSIFLAE